MELALALFAEAAAGRGRGRGGAARRGRAGTRWCSSPGRRAGAGGGEPADAAIDKLAQVPPTAEALAAAVGPLVGRRAVALRQPEGFAAFVAGTARAGAASSARRRSRSGGRRSSGRGRSRSSRRRGYLPAAARIDVQVAPVEG
ncbi:MAG: hypothetical protein H6705_20620 [Myxococcales bacterium]|nr:hypothetical protein [Myxococcales bacterium]